MTFKNCVPQGSLLYLIVLKIYIMDITETKSSKYGYAEDMCILGTADYCKQVYYIQPGCTQLFLSNMALQIEREKNWHNMLPPQ